jgi:hypothetical protein
MISRYEDLYPLMQVELPGIDDPLLLQYLQFTGREFCRRTEAWREKLTYNIVDVDDAGDTAYDAAIALGMSVAAATIAEEAAEDSAKEYTLKPHYDAEVIRPWKVWDTGDENDPPLDPSAYDFTPSSQVLTLNYTPQSYSPVATTWATTTAYAAGDHVIYSSLRYICAIAHTSGTWATDLAAYYWKQEPNDLIIRAVLLPRLFCCELAGWFMEKWAEAIINGTKAELMRMENKSWSQPKRAFECQIEYQRFVNMALRERSVEDKSQGMTFKTPSWIP